MGGGVTIGAGTNYAGTWSDGARRATVAIGVVEKDEVGSKRFVTGGAGVIIVDPRGRIFIATALHVFDNASENWAPITLQIRGWKDEQHDPYKDFGSTLTLRKNGNPVYFASEAFDLAIVQITEEIARRLQSDDGKVTAVTVADIGNSADIYDGADVFILGFPGLVGEDYQQRALMRAGIVAWTDSSGPMNHEFLVDARIFPGNSGGPVYSSAAGMTRDASISSAKPIKLLGIVSKTINAKPELALGTSLPNDPMVIGAAGVGIIEPAHELINMMAQVP